MWHHKSNTLDNRIVPVRDKKNSDQWVLKDAKNLVCSIFATGCGFLLKSFDQPQG